MKKRKAGGSLNPYRSALFLFGISLLVVVGDQLTKSLAIEFLRSRSSIPIVPNYFHLTFVENSGIAFGWLDHHPQWLTVLITLSVAALSIYAWYFRNQGRWQRLAYGFILGGAIGNWIDRLRYQHVIDFLDFRVWPVFNVADSFITIGVMLFVWFAIRGKS